MYLILPYPWYRLLFMQKIPTLLFLYGEDDSTNDVPFANAAIQDASYRAFYTRAQNEYGMRVVRASVDWFVDGVWSKYWTFNGTEWIKHTESIVPDLVIDKSTFNPEKYQRYQEIQQKTILLNPWEMKTVTSDKLITAIAFAGYAPQTRVVYSTSELQQAIDTVKTTEVVVKPQHGFGGTGVQILSHAEAKKLQIDTPHIVQPCIDTSGGIAGIVEGYHDLRVVMMGNEPVFSYIRTPAPGSKLCNLTQGGDPICVPIADIPEAALKVIEEVQKRFSVFSRSIYCIDFLFDENQQPWIVEMNDSPGIYYPPGSDELQDLAITSYLSYCSALMK